MFARMGHEQNGLGYTMTTHDAKAREAAAKAAKVAARAESKLRTMDFPAWLLSEWQIVADAAIDAYLATRSQSIPDELKAIAERRHKRAHDRAEGFVPEANEVDECLSDLDSVLSFIPAVVRACVTLCQQHAKLNMGIAKDRDAKDHRAEAHEWQLCSNTWTIAAEEIFKILDHPIKSEQQIREEERERCAKIAEELGWTIRPKDWEAQSHANKIATAIRDSQSSPKSTLDIEEMQKIIFRAIIERIHTATDSEAYIAAENAATAIRNEKTEG